MTFEGDLAGTVSFSDTWPGKNWGQESRAVLCLDMKGFMMHCWVTWSGAFSLLPWWMKRQRHHFLLYSWVCMFPVSSLNKEVFFPSIHGFLAILSPNTGLKHMTLRLRVSCSASMDYSAIGRIQDSKWDRLQNHIIWIWHVVLLDNCPSHSLHE